MTKQEIGQWVRNWMKEHPGCKDLTEMYDAFDNIKDNVVDIGRLTELIWGMHPLYHMSYITDRMFDGYTALTSISIPNHIDVIGRGAFYNCNQLTNVELPRNIMGIEDYTFEGCSRLSRITIPSGVRYIGINAFYRCNSLTNIVYEGTEEEWNKIRKGRNWISRKNKVVVHCSDGITTLIH